jgi:hypothetical protein
MFLFNWNSCCFHHTNHSLLRYKSFWRTPEKKDHNVIFYLYYVYTIKLQIFKLKRYVKEQLVVVNIFISGAVRWTKPPKWILTLPSFVSPKSEWHIERLSCRIVNIYDMVWKPFVLGDCVPCAGSRLKNPLTALSFYCLTIVRSESLAKGMGTKYLFCLAGLYLTAYFANNEVLPPFFDGECLCYIVWSILID